MRFDKFTIKAQEAIQESQNIAEKYDHQQIEPEHLLMALTLKQEGIVVPILQKLGIDPPVVLQTGRRSSPKKSSGSGGWRRSSVYISTP